MEGVAEGPARKKAGLAGRLGGSNRQTGTCTPVGRYEKFARKLERGQKGKKGGEQEKSQLVRNDNRSGGGGSGGEKKKLRPW